MPGASGIGGAEFLAEDETEDEEDCPAAPAASSALPRNAEGDWPG